MKRLIIILLILLAFCVPSYAALSDNLDASYSFDSDLTDNLGTYNGSGTVTYDTSTQKLGSGAVICDGSHAISTAYQPTTVTAFSSAGWIKHDASALNDGVFGMVNSTDAVGIGLQTRVSGGDGFLAYVSTNGTTYAQVDYDTVTNWVHYVFVYDGSQSTNATRLKLYLNGSLQTLTFAGTIPASVTVTKAVSMCDIGPSYGRYWPGKLDEVSFWSRALTQAEAMMLYNLGMGQAYPYNPTDIVIVNDLQQRVWQRDGTIGNSIVYLDGEYAGTPGAIQAQIITNTSGTVVEPWQTLASPYLSGGIWNGTISVPANRDLLKAQLRFSANHLVNTTSQTFVSGDIILLIGQSNGDYYSTSFSGTGTQTEPGAFVYYRADSAWRAPLYNGETAFLNQYVSTTGVGAGLVNFAVASSGLNSAANSGADYWLNQAASSIWDNTKTAMATLGNSVAAVGWIQGENDLYYGITSTQYTTDMTTLFGRVRSTFVNESGKASIPIVVITMGCSLTWAGENMTDVRAQAFKHDHFDVAESISNTFGIQACDIPQQDIWHFVKTGYNKHGKRMGQAVAYALGHASYYRGPTVKAAYYVDATHTDIDITHSEGSDLSPSSGITGFSANIANVTSAVRIYSNAIRLTTDYELPVGVGQVQYLYGKNPDQSGAVVDNTSVGEPLSFFDYITVEARPITSTGSRCSPQVGTPCSNNATPLHEGVPETSTVGTPCFSGLGDGTCYRR